MSYSNPNLVTYFYPALVFTAAITRAIKPPLKHTRGNVIDIHVSVTVIFTQVTTPGFVRVGTAGTNAKYAELNMGAAAANSAYSTRDAVASGLKPIISDIDLVRDNVSAIQFNVVPMTGGSPTGTGDLAITIAWS
jgi:hypothetical protein